MPDGCRIASCCPLIVPPSCQLVAPVTPACCCIASPRPLIALPSRRLVAPAGCRIASCRPLVAPPSHQLVAPACCRITSPHPLVAPRTTLSSSCCVGWLLHCLLMCRPLVASLSHRAASHCLIDPAGCCVIICHRPLIVPPSRPLIMLTGCCIACPCAARSSSRRGPLPTPSNAVECCCRHRTPPPPPPLNAVSIIHCCHSCHPLPPSNVNTHIAAVKHWRPPSPPATADVNFHPRLITPLRHH